MSEVKLAIVGSRDFQPLGLVREFVDMLPGNVTVVSGGARGVDAAAESQAWKAGLDVISLRPRWDKGRGAGLERNTDIVNTADHVVAFWDGQSRGTADTIAKAKRAGKLLAILKEHPAVFFDIEDVLHVLKGEATQAAQG